MRSEASDATYVEFASARLEELRRIASEVGDREAAHDILGEALVRLYVAWPQVEHDGTEETYAREVVAETARRRSRRGFRSPGPSVVDSLVVGRSVVRRRRRRAVWSATIGALALVAVAPLLIPRAAAPGSGGDDVLPPPAPARVQPQGTVHLLTAPAADVTADTPPVLYLFGRMFRRDRGVTVLATYGEIDHAGDLPQGGAIVRAGGRTLWVALVGNGPGRLVAQRVAAYDYPAFMAWARSETS